MSIPRLIAALVLALFAVLSIFRAPHYQLWKPAIVATELSLCLIPFCIALLIRRKKRDLPSIVAAVAAVLFCVPWVRAGLQAHEVEQKVTQVFGAEPLHADSVAHSVALTQALGPSGSVEPVFHQFSKAHNLSLDFYAATGPGPHPVLVHIHGGSWTAGDASQLPGVNHYLAPRGVSVAAITYRLAPDHIHPAQLDDVGAALDWLQSQHKELNIDPNRLVLLGRSAGAHLAMLSAYARPRPGIRGVVSLYGPTDLVWSWNNPANPWVIDTPATLGDFLGGSYEERPEAYRQASPMTHTSSTSPPTLLIHGGRDELVSSTQSKRLSEQLTKLGVKNVWVDLPWDTHGLEVHLGGPGAQLYLWSLDRFLAKVFQPPSP